MPTIHPYSFLGCRAELSPATDHWMMGDQWGTIESVTYNTGDIYMKMDRSGKRIKVNVLNLMPRKDVRQLVEACGKTLDLDRCEIR